MRSQFCGVRVECGRRSAESADSIDGDIGLCAGVCSGFSVVGAAGCDGETAAGLALACEIIGKFGGCSLAARVIGFSWRESTCIGARMNTRGLMKLVVINAEYELHVIPESVYCMLVLMVIVTTVMTVPVLLE